MESVLFLCAHNDDQIVGAGGTVAKYAKEGKQIVTIVFSFGEVSAPHIKETECRKIRVKEAKRASKILGESELYYLGLKEGNFIKDIEEKGYESRIENIIKRVAPVKIFTHSLDDPHPDHRAVYHFTMSILDKLKFKGDVYTFNVWNLFFNFRKRNYPKLVVDITDTFKTKVKAFRTHKSQLPAILSLTWTIYLQAILHGFNHNCKYAEVFYKVR